MKVLASGHEADKKWRKMEDAECQEEAKPVSPQGIAKSISWQFNKSKGR